MDAGLARTVHHMGGADLAPLGWAEIAAWVDGAGLADLDPFWRRQVMRLSAEYVSSANVATALDAPVPFQPEKD